MKIEYHKYQKNKLNEPSNKERNKHIKAQLKTLEKRMENLKISQQQQKKK